MLLSIVPASRARILGEGLTYRSATSIAAGSVVRIPLRRQMVEGIVVGEADEPVASLRDVGAVLLEEPLLPQHCLDVAQWMAHRYRCTLHDAMLPFLPPSPWRSVLPPATRTYTWNATATGNPRGSAQRRVQEALLSGPLEEAALLEQADVPRTLLRAMTSAGWLAVIDTAPSLETAAAPLSPATVLLTPQQDSAYRQLVAAKRPSLLFGVTASGKTEIYAQLVNDCIQSGRQAIILVPEILLTGQVVDRFARLLGRERIVVIHSRMGVAARRTAWRRARSGEAALVIGSRSALFAPLPRLGLVVIDEEHEWTYKNEQSPRYVTRDTAEELCRRTGARLVLGTATPSCEAWHRAANGLYQLVRLPERYNNAPHPRVRVIDLREARFGSSYPFTPPLLDALQQRLDRGEQSVLFLNRRGIASALLCLQCRRRLVSAASGLPYTLHRNGNHPVLIDHIGGERRDVPERCPGCGSPSLHAVGAGTERVEEILAQRFPAARILRADSDSLRTPDAMQELLEQMRAGDADILIGTQLVVKGLDLPGITLAAVLVADIGLSIPDFRAGERVAQLLTQLVGRSGRHQPGDVLIQTFRPDAPEIRCALENQFEQYLENECAVRAALHYPPSVPMIRCILRGPDARRLADRLHARCIEAAGQLDKDVRVSRAPALFQPGTWHVFLRGDACDAVLGSTPLDGVIVDRDPIACC